MEGSVISVIDTVLERFSDPVIQELDLLSGIEGLVEWFEKELRLVHTSLEHVKSQEHPGVGVSVDSNNNWVNEASKVFVELEDVFDGFVSILLDNRRKRSVLFSIKTLIHRRKIGIELENIKVRIRDVSKTRPPPLPLPLLPIASTSTSQESGIGIIESANTTVASVITTIESILNENLIVSTGTIEHAKQLIGELRQLCGVLDPYIPGIELDERARAWAEEANRVAEFALPIFESFASKIPNKGIFKVFFSDPKDLKLREDMKKIGTRLQNLNHRKLTYGIQDFGVREKPTISSVPIMSSGGIFSQEIQNSVDDQLESMMAELNMVCAFLKDVDGTNDLDKSAAAWVADMIDIVYPVKEFVKAEHGKKRKNLGDVIARQKIAKKIHLTRKKVDKICLLKNDIGEIEGQKGSSFGKKSQDKKDEMQVVVHHKTKFINFGQTNIEREGKFAIQCCYLTQFMFPGITKRKKGQSSETIEISDESNSEERGYAINGKNLLCVSDKKLAENVKSSTKTLEAVATDAGADVHDCGILSQRMLNPVRVEDRKKRELKKGKTILIMNQRVTMTRSDVIKRSGDSNIMDRILYRTSEEQQIIGLHEDVQAVMAQLLTDNKHLSIVSIVGMEGIGKTVLAKLIYNNKAIEHHFPRRHWVDIPSTCNVERLLEDKKVLMMRKQTITTPATFNRYLIILDDVRTIEVWDTLKEAFEDTLNGSRIVLTTRSVSVAKYADRKSVPHRLKLLSDDDSWSLFAHTLIIPPEVLEESKIAVMECGGLPQTIIELREQFVHLQSNSKWSEVLEKLDLVDKPWLETLDVIKNHGLPLNLRRCLSYFRQFPRKFEIPTRRLVLLWVAETESLVRLMRDESVAESCLTDLIDRNMVQVTKRKLNGEVKRCRLPLPLQKIWLSEAGRAISVIGRSKTSHFLRVSDHFNQKDQPIFGHIHSDTPNPRLLRKYYKDLRSFHSFDTRMENKAGEDLGHFLKRCIYSGCFVSLLVLDLESVFRPKLPETLGKLTRLRYLGLRWTCLETLPLFISKLLNLQTLDVKHTQISTLPKSIWRMQQLCHLYMDESYRCRFVPRPSGCSLTHLRTLWGAFVDEESPVKDGLDTLTNLQKLGLQCRSVSSQEDSMSSQLKAVAEWVSKLENLRSLRLKSYNENGKPWDLHLNPLSTNSSLTSLYLLGRIKDPSVMFDLPKNLTEITLSASGLTVNPMQQLKELPKLRFLQLLSESYKGTNMCCSLGGFPQLRVLKLWKLEKLELWDVEIGALPSLRDLEIRSCTKLEILPDGLRYVRTLKRFEISDMSRTLKDRIIDKQGEDWYKISHVPCFYLDDILISKRDAVTESLSIIKQSQKASQIWMPKIEQRESIFLQKIASGTLEAKFPVGSIECPFCGTEPESEVHLFFLCKVVKMIWFSELGFRTDDFSHLSISNWITRILNPSLIFGFTPPGKENFLLFAVILMEKTWLWRKRALDGVAFEPETIHRETCSEFTKRLMQQ